MKKRYHWVLFDADETLFHFDAFRGLQRMFAPYGVTFTEQDYVAYQAVNKPLWVHYQNGHMNAQQVQCDRFNAWAEKLNVASKTLNSAFLKAMADICTPIDGAVNLLNTLKGHAKLGIITNGFTELQQVRLEATGLDHYFDVLVISEEVGVAKPHPDIFEHALTLMGNPPREHVLMVGDNPDSDILGGINAGFDTCWLNTHRRSVPAGITPKYEVSSLEDLERLLRAFHL
ncbi:MAG: pyrimidine 5'-nucleotidase [Gammaproteobacteria bacterium]